MPDQDPRPSPASRRAASATAVLVAAGLCATALVPVAGRALAGRGVRAQLATLERTVPPSCDGLELATAVGVERSGPLLSSWQTVGGCGAGSSTGIGGIKWVGRNVTGGLVHVQCQGNYTRYRDGYSYTFNNLLDVNAGEKWNFGVLVPYLYKWIDDPWGANIDVSNQGPGDLNAMVSRRFGAINDTTLTFSVGFPTGTYRAKYKVNPLPQDRQLGAGKMSGALLLEHTLDNLWGPVILGGTVSYPGGQNSEENYRAPSGTLYGYAGYLFGPLVPALGLSATGFAGRDRDKTLPSERPPFMAAVNASLEWSNDWVAVLVGGSLPFSTNGLQPWTAGLGVAFAPF